MYMTQTQVAQQQGAYKQLGGAVFGGASFGFMPAFMELTSEEVHLSAYRDGQPAVVHVLDGLPHHWVAEWGQDGQAVSLKAGVVVGFMRGSHFYTLNEIMNFLRDG